MKVYQVIFCLHVCQRPQRFYDDVIISDCLWLSLFVNTFHVALLIGTVNTCSVMPEGKYQR